MRRIEVAALALFAAGCSEAAPAPSGPTPPFLHLTAKAGADFELSEKITPGSVGRHFEPIETPEQAVELCTLLHRGPRVGSREQFVRVVEAYRRQGLQPEFPAVPVKTEFDTKVTTVAGGYHVAFTTLVLGTRLEVARVAYRVAQDGWIDVIDRTAYLTGPARPGLVEELRGICSSR